jgi:hypothetical protein
MSGEEDPYDGEIDDSISDDCNVAATRAADRESAILRSSQMHNHIKLPQIGIYFRKCPWLPIRRVVKMRNLPNFLRTVLKKHFAIDENFCYGCGGPDRAFQLGMLNNDVIADHVFDTFTLGN